jgi:hypothetical protein
MDADEEDMDVSDPVDQMIEEVEDRWGVTLGEMAVMCGSVVSAESVVERVERLLPLLVTEESRNGGDPESSAYGSTDPTEYAFHNELLAGTDHGPQELTFVHDDLFESRKRRLGEYGELLHNVRSLVVERQQCGGVAHMNEDLKKRMTRLVEILYYAEAMQIAKRHLMGLLSSGTEGVQNVPGATIPATVFAKRFKTMDTETKRSAIQELFMAMLERLSQLGYRRHEQNVMEPVHINGRYTYAWQKVCTVAEFVWQHINAQLYAENFTLATQSRGNVDATIQYLEKCCQPEFEELRFNRRIHAFRNAVYIASITDPESGAYLKKSHTVYFDEGESAVLRRMTGTGEVAVAFHDCDFPNREQLSMADVRGLTPRLNQIMDHQEWPEEVKQWNRAMLGRFLHPISSAPSPNVLDCWQVVLQYTGLAGAGKSTLLDHVVYNFFPCMTAYIQNNNEKTFGWAKCKGKMIWLASEVKEDFAVHTDQALWQQIVEGGRVSTGCKYGEPILFDPFDLPGGMAGNERIGWSDNGESISRRIVDFYFGKLVTNADPMLPAELFKELGAIMYVCNEAYLEKTTHVKSRIWNSLPKYFWDLRKENAAQTNPLTHFLQNGRLEFHPDFKTTFLDLANEYKVHCAENNIRNFKPLNHNTKDYYAGPFAQHGLRKVTVNKRHSVQGCRIMEATSEPLEQNQVGDNGDSGVGGDSGDSGDSGESGVGVRGDNSG